MSPSTPKTPLEAYLRANESDDDVEQRAALGQHAAALMSHARALGRKNYADAIDGKSPDFVVLFVPTETILDAAMVAQPTIWEDAWTQHKVLIASPGLLIALLRTIGVAWQQEDIQQNAQEIADTSRELYGRLATYSDHVGNVGKALTSAVRAYNSSVGSFQSRVLVQARRMGELGAVEESRRIEDPRLRRARSVPADRAGAPTRRRRVSVHLRRPRASITLAGWTDQRLSRTV